MKSFPSALIKVIDLFVLHILKEWKTISHTFAFLADAYETSRVTHRCFEMRSAVLQVALKLHAALISMKPDLEAKIL